MDGGGGFSFAEAAALYRLDLDSGQITETLSPGKSDRNYYSLGFSPNDRRLAYFDTSAKPFLLKIYDFQTGNNETIDIGPKYNSGGNLIWSDNGQFLVFSAAYYDHLFDTYLVSVLLWDNQKKTLETLIDNFNVALYPTKWIDESTILLESNFSPNPLSYEFDLDSKTLKAVSP
jgi:Tol biopolymer transport system component